MVFRSKTVYQELEVSQEQGLLHSHLLHSQETALQKVPKVFPHPPPELEQQSGVLSESPARNIY